MLRHRVCFPVARVAWVWAASLVAMSCSGPTPRSSEQVLPTTPSPLVTGPVAAGTDRSLPASAREAALFPFLNGTFVITTEAGDRLTGISSGHLAVPIPGRSTISVGLLATGGTGIFRGASGVVTGDGGGEFEVGNERHVVVSSITGVLQTAAVPAGFRFHITIEGTSILSCGRVTRIQLTIRGEGTIATVGRATALLTTELDNTYCES